MSVLHTEEALLPVRHSPDSGDCGLVPWKEWLWGFCFSLALAGELNRLGMNCVPSCFWFALAASLST